MVQGKAPRRLSPRLVLILVLALGLIGGAVLVGRGREASAREDIGLFTSLPIVWRESRALSDLLASEAPPHWALGVIGGRGAMRPLDTLADGEGRLPLPRRAVLIMAQPRPLSPGENVALDDWVRGGGRLLLFADPMLTSHSAYALGDKRRPQDIVLLSPILRRWGLELEFDDGQPGGEREVALFDAPVPVELPGRFARAGSGRCVLAAQGLAALCRVGRGEVLAIADAALLDDVPDDVNRRREALGRLLDVLAGRD